MSVAVVAKLTGKAFIIRGSESLPLALDSELHASDSVRTEAGAKVELLFTDGAIIELGPSTQVELKDFAFDPQGESKPSFVMHMLEGAVRSVSGKVVEQNPEAFKLTSPLGAVGIRGTSTLHIINASHEVHIVQEITGDHTVYITTPDGRSLTMTGSALGVTITSGDFSPLVLQTIPLGQMQELLKIWLDENKASESNQHFTTGDTADLIYKLAALFISGHLGADGLAAGSLVGLEPLSLSESEGIGSLESSYLVDPPGGDDGWGGPASPLPALSNIINGTPGPNWLMAQPGDNIISAGKGNDFLFGGAGFDTLSGGYGSSDTLVKPYSMQAGDIIYGDEEILPAGATADADHIYVGAAPSGMSTFLDEDGVSHDPTPYMDTSTYGPGDMNGGIIYGNARIMESGSSVDAGLTTILLT